jgi:hypothetical protein
VRNAVHPESWDRLTYGCDEFSIASG